VLVNRAIFIESTASPDELNPLLRKGDLLLPSIKRGDLLKLYSSYPSIKEVIIVDGVFEQQPSITHKEILWLLSQDVSVVGIASIGALRAYELRNHGMIGYGWVYEQFIKEIIDGDDEVAVAFDPFDPINSKTLAMINFRKTANEEKYLYNYLTIIKNIYFRERTWNNLSVQLPNNIVSKFFNAYNDIKKEDVLNYLQTSIPVEKADGVGFIPNIYFKELQQICLEASILEYIRLRIIQINNDESVPINVYRENYEDICKFLSIPLKFSHQIALILNNFTGIGLNKAKIKILSSKIQFQLNLCTAQKLREYFLKIGIPLNKIKILFENLAKLFGYFLCK